MRSRILLACLMSMSLTVFAEFKESKPRKKSIANHKPKEIPRASQTGKPKPREAKAVGPHPLIGEWQAASNVCKKGDDFQTPSEIKKPNVQIKTEFKGDGTTRVKLLFEGKPAEMIAAGTFEIEDQKLSMEITSIEYQSDKLSMRVPSIPKFAFKEDQLLIEDTQSYGGSKCPTGSQSYLVYNRAPLVNVGGITTVDPAKGAAFH